MKKHTARTTTRPLTENQRLSLARRAEQRAVEQALANIGQSIREAPDGWRRSMADALALIATNGYLFTIAAGKAAVLVGRFGPQQDQFWTFIDQHNERFRQLMPADIVDRWRTPDYIVPTTAPHSQDEQPCAAVK
jgi:hypothetical protein